MLTFIKTLCYVILYLLALFGLACVSLIAWLMRQPDLRTQQQQTVNDFTG